MATLPPATIELPTNDPVVIGGLVTVETWLIGPVKLSPHDWT
jgi:hypothetical protein